MDKKIAGFKNLQIRINLKVEELKKGGSKGCKLAMKGKGRAYGKNS